MKIYSGFVLVSIFFWSCQNSQTKEVVIQKMIEEDVKQRVVKFIEVREEVCRKQVLERAINLADSIMLEEVRQIKINSAVPNTSKKPSRPEVKVKEAYDKVRPLFDSLKRNKKVN